MFNFLNNYKHIEDGVKDLTSKAKGADDNQKSLIRKLFLVGIALMLLIGVIQVIIAISFREQYLPPIQDVVIEEQIELDETPQEELPEDSGVIDIPQEELGRGQSIPNPIDMLNPFSSFQESIVDAISEILLQGLELFDDYVSFTPNIAQRDGYIVDARGNDIPIHVNKFFNATQSVAWMLLPLIIVITGSYVILEGSFKGIMLLKEIGKKVILFVVGMVAMRFFFATAIDLTNALNQFVLHNLVGGGDTLSDSLLASLGLQIMEQKLEFTIQGTLNIFAEIILWIGLFFLLVTLLFQFIIRFFHLLLHMIMFPIVMVIGLLPNGGKFFSSYIEEVLRTLFMQPIFLIGIGIAIEIISSVDEPVPKVILGLGSLAFLNIIPAIVNRFSGILWGVGGSVAGGIVAGATIGQAKKMKEGIVSGASGGQSSSIRNLAGKSIGSAIVSKLPMGNTAKKATNTGFQIAGKGSSSKKATEGFKQAVASGKSSNVAFSKLGMKPLDGRSIKDVKGQKTLYSTKPNFDPIKDLSVKDNNIVSNGFKKENSLLNEYPLTDKPAGIHQMMDLSSNSFSNPNTTQHLSNAISSSPVEVEQGRTFDTSNQKHWNHVTDWYGKNEAITGKHSPKQVQEFIQNPKNKMQIIRKAQGNGYFESQGINTIKMKDQIKGQKPVTKYYQVKSKIKPNAGNSTSKTK
jgi:hypothetical protein